MNNMMKRLLRTDYKKMLTLGIIFIFSLALSAFIYIVIGQETITKINYKQISSMSFITVFLKIFKRNIIYFVAIICLTYIGQSKIIIGIFGLVSVYYGLSIIYLIKIIQMNKIYFLFTFTDYFVFFPILFYFTYISIVISKYTKKTKKIETISNKFDIIITNYIKTSFLYLFMVIGYSIVYSYYILILSRLLVN